LDATVRENGGVPYSSTKGAAMLIENEHFDPDNALPEVLRDDVFRTSSFDGLELEGVTFDGIFESSSTARW
jgi:hypothetical protein